ncbi:MAG: hypothetical protein HOF35_13750 [Bacteroidetes bacterium]|nr:hypothetical protein [Bacteroidota bacterium]MBT6836936.1 hypothetical protein [Bacteroidota bacterium]
MRLITILSSAIILLAFTCSAQQKVSITTMRPAEISLSSDVKTVLVANRFYPANQAQDSNRMEEQIATSLGQDASNKCIQAIISQINQCNRFDTIIPIHIAVGRNQQISEQKVKTICQKYNADILILLDDFRFNKEMIQKRRCIDITYQAPCRKYGFYWGIKDVNLTVALKLFFPEDYTKNFELPLYSSFNELYPAHHIDSIHYSKDDELCITKITGQYAGLELCRKLAPYWEREFRFLYAYSRKDLHDAVSMIQGGEISEAIEVLKVIESEGSQSERYKAKMNLAYCYEMKDVIWKAKKYATEAYRMKGTKEALELANRLYERDLERRKLKEQFGE